MNDHFDHHHLSRLLAESARLHPEAIAVEDSAGAKITYRELAHAADRIATRLTRWGVGRGDRVGLFLPKSIEAVAAIHGILQAGAAYVPVDATAPPSRGAEILADAKIKAMIVAERLAPALEAAWPNCGPRPRRIVVGQAQSTTDASWTEVLEDDAPTPLEPPRRACDPAYILYTSGSTGRAKGVLLSHANAFAFLDWCNEAFPLHSTDRVASHAPFHFDLSVFDLFQSCRSAASLVLIDEVLAREPVRLGEFITSREIDVWYSAPSILALLADYGGLEKSGRRAPRIALFAGEVFPITSLRRLRNLWPTTTFWNLYGPTETNVCTAQRIPDTVDASQADVFPIGQVCASHHARVVGEDGQDVAPGTLGELWISGPGVMQCYFGRPDLTEETIVIDTDGARWYRTGDLVTDIGNGVFQFHGRRDRMIKKRGYRIELGEVESALYRHAEVDRAAVVAQHDSEAGVSIAAFVALKPAGKASIIAMKQHCIKHLPHYMVPDSFTFLPHLPTTSTDKVNYRELRTMS